MICGLWEVLIFGSISTGWATYPRECAGDAGIRAEQLSRIQVQLNQCFGWWGPLSDPRLATRIIAKLLRSQWETFR